MKHLINYLYCLLIAAALTACSDDDGGAGSVAGGQMEKLAGTWKATAVEVDETSPGGFEDFTISLSPVQGRERLSYIITNNPYQTPWVAVSTGYFIFHTDEPAKYLVREDGVTVTYAVSETTLTMSFIYDESTAGGRTAGVSGTWEFFFEKLQ